MSTIFILVFIAAIVGVFKPYIKNLNRKHFGIAAIIAFVLVGVTAPASDSTNREKVQTVSTASASTESSQDRVAQPPTPASKWMYSTNKDEMRGTTAKYASLKSENQVDLDFPYGTVSGEITIRRRPEDGLNVMFSVEKGQVLCHSFTDSYVSVKFDDGPIKRYSCTSASDGSTETAFLSSEQSLLERLKSSKKAVLEAEFYQQGRQQFVFETTGLEW